MPGARDEAPNCILQHQGPDMVDDMGHKGASGPGETVREFWEVFLIPWHQGSHQVGSCPPGDPGPRLGTCLVVATERAPGIKGVGAGEAAQHPQCPDGPTVSSFKGERP